MTDLAATSAKTYLVGGAVRDRLLGRASADRDWVVVGSTPEQMVARGFRPVGRDFPVFIDPSTGEEHALARTERKSGRGYHGFAFQASPEVTLEDDLRRRDLTINAIAQAPDGTLIDPFGGVQDLERRLLRHVSPAFAEDPLRVLRACGALAVLFPEVDALYGVPQRPEYHPEVDTGVHVELVLEMAARLAPGDALIGWCALVHDLGKAVTPREELPRHVSHEQHGVPLVRAVNERYKVPYEYASCGVLTCKWHLVAHQALTLKPSTIVRLFERIDAFRRPERVRVFLTACEADKRGRTGLAERPYPQRAYLEACFAAARSVTAAPFLAAGLEGPAIGEEIKRARIQYVAEVPKPTP